MTLPNDDFYRCAGTMTAQAPRLPPIMRPLLGFLSGYAQA